MWAENTSISVVIAQRCTFSILIIWGNSFIRSSSILSTSNPRGAISSKITPDSLSILIAHIKIRIEIPMAFSLPFGKFAARRWPLKFFYTSNIPVILIAAVIANMQVVGKMMSEKGLTFFGQYDASGQVTGGLVYYLTAPNSIGLMIMVILAGILALGFALLAVRMWKKYALRMSLVGAMFGILVGYFIISSIAEIPVVAVSDYIRGFTYMMTMIIGSTIFSIFWMSTAGMDAKSVAEQFKSSFLSIPGFRRDPRIVEHVLNRYIPSLAVLGGAFVGFLAGFADLTSAIGTGTGILLAVMIVYQFYESIAQQHMEDMHPAVRKFMGGS